MPHLAPLSWIAAPLILLTGLIATSVLLWWQYTPIFPTPPQNPRSINHTRWHWCWNGWVMSSSL
uniref:ATP synthase F0 subunit 8 n=2 Tax=Nereididae TaxID=39820 RepID=A0A343J7F3_9ANNE|nr:ATP synthase F0 subunit 8 [Neanthes glandicincta]ASW20403.1 ATP synthase F0 subunit 8 [Neanthes glandicincta]